jgi:hypothetical protein
MSEPSSEHDLLAVEILDAELAVHTLQGAGTSGAGYDCFAGAPTRRVPPFVTAAAPGCRFSGVQSEVIDLITSQLDGTTEPA